jgi:hypothetical protein
MHFLAGCIFSAKQVLPRAGIGLNSMNCGLNLVAPIVAAHPHHAVSRFATLVQNPNHVSTSQIYIDARQQRPTDADVASPGFLQEAFASGIHPPDCDGKIGLPARFIAAIHPAKNSHISFFTVTPCPGSVKITTSAFPARMRRESSVMEIPELGRDGKAGQMRTED